MLAANSPTTRRASWGGSCKGADRSRHKKKPRGTQYGAKSGEKHIQLCRLEQHGCTLARPLCSEEATHSQWQRRGKQTKHCSMRWAFPFGKPDRGHAEANSRNTRSYRRLNWRPVVGQKGTGNSPLGREKPDRYRNTGPGFSGGSLRGRLLRVRYCSTMSANAVPAIPLNASTAHGNRQPRQTAAGLHELQYLVVAYRCQGAAIRRGPSGVHALRRGR